MSRCEVIENVDGTRTPRQCFAEAPYEARPTRGGAFMCCREHARQLHADGVTLGCDGCGADVGEEVPWKGAPLCVECSEEASREFNQEARAEAARGC